MKAKISPNLVSYITVRRGDWILKVSVFKNQQAMVVAQNYYATEQIRIKCFLDQNAAADYIENLIKDDV